MMANFSVANKVTLGQVLPAGVSIEAAVAGLQLAGLDIDSRSVEPGDAFLACPGTVSDGRDYINEAIANGASVVFYEAEAAELEEQSVPMIAVDSLAEKVSEVSAHYFSHPSRAMRCIGVTGTNGKTSCAFWIAHLLKLSGGKAAMVGTLGYGVVGDTDLTPTGHTTPDPVRIQAMLAELQQQSVQHTVMEVSSHSLDQHRVAAVEFDVALLTNLSRDHLDYHGDMESYGEAKARLFDFDSLHGMVLNIDDAFGRSLLERLPCDKVITYGLNSVDADLRVQDLTYNASGASGELLTPWGSRKFSAPVFGDFNVANLLGVVAVVSASGYEFADVVDKLPSLPIPPGRLQKVSVSEVDVCPAVFVDYAHTPDALEKVLGTLKPLAKGRLWCVFGCGGDRDKGKRALMGKAAADYADVCVVTSDNPRSENPQAIIDDIGKAFSGSEYLQFIDRAEAIRHAVASATTEDVILIAGKGHENYQEISGVRHDFDDVVVAQNAMLACGGAA